MIKKFILTTAGPQQTLLQLFSASSFAFAPLPHQLSGAHYPLVGLSFAGSSKRPLTSCVSLLRTAAMTPASADAKSLMNACVCVSPFCFGSLRHELPTSSFLCLPVTFYGERPHRFLRFLLLSGAACMAATHGAILSAQAFN